jgi:hypothetical protein
MDCGIMVCQENPEGKAGANAGNLRRIQLCHHDD